MNPVGRMIRNAYLMVRKRYHRLVHIHVDIAVQKFRLRGYTDAILEVTPGDRERGNGRYAVFVVFPGKGALEPSVVRALTALDRAGVDVLVVSNAPLNETAMAMLRPLVWRIMRRGNVGFDFGAYKDGVLWMARERPDLERLLILNDSVFFSSVGLDDYVAALLGEADAISAFENWGEGYHMQSFAVSCSGHVFRSPEFHGYWKSYVPVGNRIYAIEYGEKRLSDAVLKAARSSHVIFETARLLEKLRDDQVGEPTEDYVVPLQWRAILTALGRGVFHVGDRYRSLIDVVNVTSPIHSGAFLFPRYMRCPIYKKDLVYRQRYQFWELSVLLKPLMPPDEYEEFMLELRRKGDHKRLPKPTLRKYEIGVK